MEARTLLRRLLAAKNGEDRRTLLEAHGPLGIAFFRLLKGQVRELVEEDSRKALQLTDIGLEAAEFTAEQESVAYAWWARGNALLFLGQYGDCLIAYSTAISILVSLGRVEEVAQLQTNCMLPLMWTGRHAEAQAMGRGSLEVLGGREETPQMANLVLNLGICALHQGDHAGAVAQTGQAAEIFARLDNAVQAARCRVTQSVALESLDRFAEAESLLRDALQVFSDHGAWVPWGRAALNLGVLCARLADHQAALRWLEDSCRAFLGAGIEMEAAVVDLYRAQCLVDVNLLPEATALGEELVETFTQLEMPRQVARAASLLAQAYTRRGRADLGHRELERARQIFHAQEDTVEVALLDLRRAALLQEAGRPGEALRLASEAAEVLDVRRYPLRHAEAHLIIAACCEELGRIEEAQVAYRVAWAAGSHPSGTTEPPPLLAYRIAHARGTIAEAVGDRALARGEYGRAVGYLTRIAQGMGLDELRGGYLADKRLVYEAPLRLALEEERVADAFRYSELARAGALRDFLAGRRHPLSTVVSPNCTALEELKARWAWRVRCLHRPVDLMAEADEEVVKPEDRPARLRELADLERELAAAYRRRRLADPRFAALEQGEVLGVDEIRRGLPDDVALLSFDHVGDHMLAFVVTRDAATVVPLGQLAGLRWDAVGLGHALEEVRLFDIPADLTVLEADILDDLQVLYQAVLAKPLARLGPEIRRLLVAPCDVLRALPLEAFHDGQGHLLERYVVCYLPSASLLAALPGSYSSPPRNGGGRDRLPDRASIADSPLVMAHSWEGRLPLVLEEAERVARALADGPGGEPLLLTEEQATTKALREHAGTAGLLHVAAHGAFRDDAPLFSSLHLADGPLTVNEIYGLDLSRAALVTLSGCQTGLGQGRGGEMLGLVHAFLFTGAPALVVSRWRVEDRAAAQLMQDFYVALTRGETVAEALRTAQLGALACRPHAGYWAAFAVWGWGFEPIFAN
jgi:tetratricopeptide (TPR) repeat protein